MVLSVKTTYSLGAVPHRGNPLCRLLANGIVRLLKFSYAELAGSVFATLAIVCKLTTPLA